MGTFLTTTLVSTIFCLLWQWQDLLILTEAGFYPSDSLYTLGQVKASALALVTMLLLLFAAYINWTLSKAVLHRVHAAAPLSIMFALLNGLLALIVYWGVLSAVPQLYYSIYLQIIPDLPNQLVVKRLMPIEQFLARLFFTARPSLSNHAAGLLGWVLFFNVLFQWLIAKHKNVF